MNEITYYDINTILKDRLVMNQYDTRLIRSKYINWLVKRNLGFRLGNSVNNQPGNYSIDIYIELEYKVYLDWMNYNL